jgi:hypothetical protein
MTALTTSASSSAWLRVIVQKDEGLWLVDREVEVEIQTAAHTLREKVAALMVMVKIVGVVLRLLDARYFCSILMKYDWDVICHKWRWIHVLFSLNWKMSMMMVMRGS